jgi:hypothetical protein
MTTETSIQDSEALIERAFLLEEVKDMTAGTAVERWLNQKYGPTASLSNPARLVKKGVEDGWAANGIDGPKYRRSRIAEPSERTLHFSITAGTWTAPGTAGTQTTGFAASTTGTRTASSTWWCPSPRQR